MDLVSIYIPTHDRRALLSRALQSALSQSYGAIEVVVADDGSTDDTAAFLREQAQRHPNLIVVRSEVPEGANAARNRAIRAAHGKLVTGLDDDDVLQRDHVQRLCAAYDARYAFVCSSYLEVFPNKRVPNRLHAGEITLADVLHYNKIGNQVLVERDRVLELGGFDEALPSFQDYDLWVRLMARFGPALKTRDTTYEFYKDHGKQRISDSVERKLRGLARFREKHAALIGPEHVRSFELMERKIRGEGIGVFELLRYVHPGNHRAALSVFVNQRMRWVQSAYHTVMGLTARGGGSNPKR